MRKLTTWKFLLVAGLAAFGAACLTDNAVSQYFDRVLGLLYPLGGTIFGGLGELPQYLGGSIGVCLIPIGLIAFFCWRRDFYWAAVSTFWLGLNFLNFSTHLREAGHLQVAASGTNAVTADWIWVFSHFNAIQNATGVGYIFQIIGILLLSAAAAAGIILSRDLVPEPTPETSSTVHPALAGADPESGRRAPPVPPTVYTPGFSSSTKSIVLMAGVLAAAVAFWAHPEWLQTLLGGKPAPAWPDNFLQAAGQAKVEGKPIVLSFTGSDWCPACQQLDKYVLNTSTFRDYVAKNLVFVEVDVPQHKSQPNALKAQNLGLVMKYNVQGFPTLVVLSSRGIFLGQIVGFDDSGPKNYIAQIEGFAGTSGKL